MSLYLAMFTPEWFVAARQYLLQLHETIHPYAELLAILLGIAAMIFAFRQFRDSMRLIGEARVLFEEVRDISHLSKELSDRVREIAGESDQLVARVGEMTAETKAIKDEMSTRFVNVFPYNLRTIVDMMGNASSSVDIMVDITGYGHYSAPEEFTKYQNKLNELALNSNVRLRMLVYGQELTAKTRDEQFGGAAKFAKIKSSTQFKHYFKEVHRGYCEPTDYAAFIKILEEKELSYEKEVKGRGAVVGCSEQPFRFYLWLIDEAEAAFSFQTYGEHFDEICFRTRDGHLIKTLTRLFTDAWEEWKESQSQRPAAAAPVNPRPPTLPPASGR
jgi:hypothetical protein